MALTWLVVMPVDLQAAAGAVADLPKVGPDEIGFSVTHWTVENGLPDRTVTSLAQTPDGFLWCGTLSGLARYGGEEFRVFDACDTPELDGVRIEELHCDAAGCLWIVGSGGELVVYENERFRRLAPADGVPAGQAGWLSGDPRGNLWVKGRSDDRFYHQRGERFEVAPAVLPASNVDHFVADDTGLTWAVHEQQRTMIRFTREGTDIRPLVAIDGSLDNTLGRFFRLQDGRMGVTSSKGIYSLERGQWRTRAVFAPTVASQALDGVEDWGGDFWVSFARVGLVWRGRDGRTALVSLPDLGETPLIRALKLDTEGNIWAGGSEGLYQIRRNTFQSCPALKELAHLQPASVIEDVASRIHIVYPKGRAVLDAGSWKFEPHVKKQECLWTAAPSRYGGIYLGCVNAKSREAFVDRIDATGEQRRLGKLAGYPRVILERRNGELWVATDEGVCRWCNERFQRVSITAASGNYPVYAMIEDNEGRLLVGAFHRGLFRLEPNGDWSRLAGTNDLGGGFIVSLYSGRDNTLWAATDRGLARWKDGQWFPFSDAAGALPSRVRGVVGDDRGGLWLTSRSSMVRAVRGALNALADGRQPDLDTVWFDRSDGLPSATCALGQRLLLKSSGGRIWVTTVKGAAVVNPSRWARRLQRLAPPSVRIANVLVDDNPSITAGTWLSRSSTLRVPPGLNRIEIRYAAINLTSNQKTRFRYQLQGYDGKWVNAQEKRSVVYHGLPPGDYRFEVKVSSQPPQRSGIPASLDFIVLPHWWQTLWFRMVAGALAVGGLCFSRQLKLRQLVRERNRREEFSRRLIRSQEEERKRIANELHDSLGQNLLVAKNQLFLVQEVTQDTEAQSRLKQVADSVTSALEEARTISHQLRPFQLERLGLSKAMRSLCRQVSESTKIPLQARIEPVEAFLPPDSEVTLYRVLQEALSNIVKHAEASGIRVEIERQGHKIQMSVQDDGRGFDVEALLHGDQATRGLGLAGFRERMNLLHGHFHCRSAPGQGTTLSFEVPITEAKTNEAHD